VIAASRRSVDDHIVLLGWFSEEKKHDAFSIELNNDSWLPRIELQGNNF
jgi:nuclear pore complex protein Nup214